MVEYQGKVKESYLKPNTTFGSTQKVELAVMKTYMWQGLEAVPLEAHLQWVAFPMIVLFCTRTTLLGVSFIQLRHEPEL
jgi:hypothetical protein